jgi:hypothetical protein
MMASFHPISPKEGCEQRRTSLRAALDEAEVADPQPLRVHRSIRVVATHCRAFRHPQYKCAAVTEKRFSQFRWPPLSSIDPNAPAIISFTLCLSRKRSPGAVLPLAIIIHLPLAIIIHKPLAIIIHLL